MNSMGVSRDISIVHASRQVDQYKRNGYRPAGTGMLPKEEVFGANMRGFNTDNVAELRRGLVNPYNVRQEVAPLSPGRYAAQTTTFTGGQPYNIDYGQLAIKRGDLEGHRLAHGMGNNAAGDLAQATQRGHHMNRLGQMEVDAVQHTSRIGVRGQSSQHEVRGAHGSAHRHSGTMFTKGCQKIGLRSAIGNVGSRSSNTVVKQGNRSQTHQKQLFNHRGAQHTNPRSQSRVDTRLNSNAENLQKNPHHTRTGHVNPRSRTKIVQTISQRTRRMPESNSNIGNANGGQTKRVSVQPRLRNGGYLQKDPRMEGVTTNAANRVYPTARTRDIETRGDGDKRGFSTVSALTRASNLPVRHRKAGGLRQVDNKISGLLNSGGGGLRTDVVVKPKTTDVRNRNGSGKGAGANGGEYYARRSEPRAFKGTEAKKFSSTSQARAFTHTPSVRSRTDYRNGLIGLRHVINAPNPARVPDQAPNGVFLQV